MERLKTDRLSCSWEWFPACRISCLKDSCLLQQSSQWVHFFFVVRIQSGEYFSSVINFPSESEFNSLKALVVLTCPEKKNIILPVEWLLLPLLLVICPELHTLPKASWTFTLELCCIYPALIVMKGHYRPYLFFCILHMGSCHNRAIYTVKHQHHTQKSNSNSRRTHPGFYLNFLAFKN